MVCSLTTQVWLHDMWGPRLKISSSRSGEGLPIVVSVPGALCG
jgi:hypothetical protein